MRRALFTTLVALAALALAAGCGERQVVSSEREVTGGETTAGETTAGGGGYQGIVDSYAVADAEIEEEGGEKTVGDYRIGYIVEPAEGWWEGDPQNLQWRDPSPDETHHLEILPFDRRTGLLIPEMEGRLYVIDQNGEVVDEQPLRFYYAEFYHYANNFSIPESGTYTLRAELEPPDFRRHGEESGEGRVFTEPVVVEFENVRITSEGG
ncbi:putative periplasmic ligand-binding sensor protein [Rubrobacter xylanophilus DSM 9941]|uniref:Putative periplasmic ligand-binding sensor protein n=1 Tax=Rubrobacter xylanophilus (strain DSM 9941 / JCM 11954 / NBRC 16129 / PRD-1) TaxID=266117 RepID=Q1AWT6_RUBXD|nr:iron transporter [Rubrobacter xylanophilus]ABG04142.1 putative periplasmic ligand-binding sensor protein [Rubrobacter xylanophilus DSM 9941]